MDREILFKGRRTDNREWVTGYVVKFKEAYWMYTGKIDKLNRFENGYGTAIYPPVKYPINPETVCRYTGLVDRNGKKIFEGDILSANLDDKCPEDITHVRVTWNGFSWCVRESTDDDVMTNWDCETFKVCGNIFDNPELLENRVKK